MNKLKSIINKLFGVSFDTPRGKNNKGISLISLIITIIVMLIIIAIVFTSSSKTDEKVSSAKILNEFIEVENAVSQRGTEHKLSSTIYAYLGDKLGDGKTETVNNVTYGEGYYHLDTADLKQLGVSGTTRDFIVNYTTGEVIAYNAFSLYDTDIYTKDDLVDQEYTLADATVEYNEEKHVNSPVLYSGMIPVKYVNGAWEVTTEDDTEWYDYVVSNGPTRMANVMLYDDITVRNSSGTVYTNEQVRSMSLSQLKGCRVVTEGSMLVWIPRYTYKGSTDSADIVYSMLTRDYVADGYIKNPAFYLGEYTGATAANANEGYVAGGRELTGIWISKYQASYAD